MKRRYLLVLISLFALVGCRQTSDFDSQEPTAVEVEESTAEAPSAEEADDPEAAAPITEETIGEFSIYLVRGEISAQQMMETDLDDLEVESTPILSVDELVSYTAKTHSIELTDAAYEKISGAEVDLIGTPFVVFVGKEPIYAGAFWATFLSSIFDGIVIDILPAMDKRPIRIQLGYPESLALFTGEDLRSDARIIRSLEAAGKLK
ncbi:MAG: hypothetical protein IMY76_06145 [Chloroflexi bacterium]|nr:hypothetical protein [Chloroflexota bacterium]